MVKRSDIWGGRLGLSGGSVDTEQTHKKYNILHMNKLKVSLKYYYYNYD